MCIDRKTKVFFHVQRLIDFSVGATSSIWENLSRVVCRKMALDGAVSRGGRSTAFRSSGVILLIFGALLSRCIGVSLEQMFQQEPHSIVYRQLFRIDLPDSATGPIQSNYIPYHLIYVTSNKWVSLRYRTDDWPAISNSTPICIYLNSDSEYYVSEAGVSRYWKDSGDVSAPENYTLRAALLHRAIMNRWILNLGIVEAPTGSIRFKGKNLAFVGRDDGQEYSGSLVTDTDDLKVLEYKSGNGIVRHVEYRFSSGQILPSEIRVYNKFEKTVEWRDLVWICEINRASAEVESVNNLDPTSIRTYYAIGLLSTNTLITRYAETGVFTKMPNGVEVPVVTRPKLRSWSFPALSVRKIVMGLFILSAFVPLVVILKTIGDSKKQK